METTLPLTLPPGRLHESFREQVERAVGEIVPSGKRGAVLAIANHEGTTLTFATKIGDTWSLDVSAGKAWHGPVTGQVRVVGSW